MSDDLALVDTNVLVYAHFEESEHHAASRELLDQAQDGQVALCITSQVLAEFYSIVTSPRRVTNPFPPEEALDAIEELLAMPGMTLLPMPADIVNDWTALARQYPVSGAGIFDLQLAATMLTGGVRRIYTFNRPDFERFAEIEVLTP